MKDARTRAEESEANALRVPGGRFGRLYVMGYLAGDSDRERLMKEELIKMTNSYERAFQRFCETKNEYEEIFKAWKKYEALSLELSDELQAARADRQELVDCVLEMADYINHRIYPRLSRYDSLIQKLRNEVDK